MMFKKRVNENERLPFGYGVAWHDFAWCQWICYPVPLNWLARWMRAFYFVLRCPPMGSKFWWEKREAEIFQGARDKAERWAREKYQREHRQILAENKQLREILERGAKFQAPAVVVLAEAINVIDRHLSKW